MVFIWKLRGRTFPQPPRVLKNRYTSSISENSNHYLFQLLIISIRVAIGGVTCQGGVTLRPKKTNFWCWRRRIFLIHGVFNKKFDFGKIRHSKYARIEKFVESYGEWADSKEINLDVPINRFISFTCSYLIYLSLMVLCILFPYTDYSIGQVTFPVLFSVYVIQWIRAISINRRRVRTMN